MDRKDKIKDAIKREYKSCDHITTKQIIETVQRYYPEIPVQSILPGDFCDNYSNEDPFSGKYHIFHKVEYGLYEVI